MLHCDVRETYNQGIFLERNAFFIWGGLWDSFQKDGNFPRLHLISSIFSRGQTFEVM